MLIECLKAILYGIVEGITEWLPISSTGHLILLEDRLPFAFSKNQAFLAEFWEMFEVVIQLGAILAVLVLFWRQLCPFFKHSDHNEKQKIWAMWGRVLVASLPAAFVGILLDCILESLTQKDLHAWLYHSFVVALMLILYGIAFLWIERIRKRKEPRIRSVEEIDLKTALLIGAFQSLSLIPGTSRSGSTILGAMLLGLSRSAGAEFSFFLAVPVMLGASGIKTLGFGKWVATQGFSVPMEAWLLLLLGCAVSFLVSIVAIRFLMDFVKKHSFAPFGIYRIALGTIVLLFSI